MNVTYGLDSESDVYILSWPFPSIILTILLRVFKLTVYKRAYFYSKSHSNYQAVEEEEPKYLQVSMLY